MRSSWFMPASSLALALLLSYAAGGSHLTALGHRASGGVTGPCEKIELAVFGDPALCLPAAKPSDPNAEECKEYVVKCCCVDDHVLHPGKVTKVTWKVGVPWLKVEGVAGFTAGADGANKGEFVTTLTGAEHKVKICIQLADYDAIAAELSKKDCYVFTPIKLEGICEADGKEHQVKSRFLLGIAKHLEAKICLRNVKKAAAAADDPANSRLNAADFAPKLQAELNRIYAQFCLSFKVEAGADVVLPASNFEADGTLKADAKDATNEDLVKAVDPGCLNVFAAARLPQGVQGGTPSSNRPPYSTVDDDAPPITTGHELGHLLGWNLIVTDPDDAGKFGTLNACRPTTQAKSDLLMLDAANRRTDKGLLSDGNLDKMWFLICAHAAHK
jgi:hypothetical protein